MVKRIIVSLVFVGVSLWICHFIAGIFLFVPLIGRSYERLFSFYHDFAVSYIASVLIFMSFRFRVGLRHLMHFLFVFVSTHSFLILSSLGTYLTGDVSIMKDSAKSFVFPEIYYILDAIQNLLGYWLFLLNKIPYLRIEHVSVLILVLGIAGCLSMYLFSLFLKKGFFRYGDLQVYSFVLVWLAWSLIFIYNTTHIPFYVDAEPMLLGWLLLGSFYCLASIAIFSLDMFLFVRLLSIITSLTRRKS